MVENGEAILSNIFNYINKVEEDARERWVNANHVPSNAEIQRYKNKSCKHVSNMLRQVNADPEITKECQEIADRFVHLNATSPTEAITGILQVNYYLYEEAKDVVKWGAWYKPGATYCNGDYDNVW